MSRRTYEERLSVAICEGLEEALAEVFATKPPPGGSMLDVKMSEPKVIVEDFVVDETLFRMRWEVLSGAYRDEEARPFRVCVEVWESIVMAGGEPKGGLFFREGHVSSNETVESTDEAQRYLSAVITGEDADSEFSFDQPLSIGGAYGFQIHCALMERIYRRAMELMGREDEWDGDES